MGYFPFMIDIQKKDCLVVGGGSVAYRKVLELLEFGAEVTVVAPEICKEIMGLPDIRVLKKAYETKDVFGRFLVIAATNAEETNRNISKDCQERQILVNAVDIKDACSFIFPAIIKKKDLVVSISTGGNSPAGAAYLKQKIGQSIPAYYEENMEILGNVRDKVMEEIPDAEDRKDFYYHLLARADGEKKILQKEKIDEYMDIWKQKR